MTTPPKQERLQHYIATFEQYQDTLDHLHLTVRNALFLSPENCQQAVAFLQEIRTLADECIVFLEEHDILVPASLERLQNTHMTTRILKINLVQKTYTAASGEKRIVQHVSMQKMLEKVQDDVQQVVQHLLSFYEKEERAI